MLTFVTRAVAVVSLAICLCVAVSLPSELVSWGNVITVASISALIAGARF